VVCCHCFAWIRREELWLRDILHKPCSHRVSVSEWVRALVWLVLAYSYLPLCTFLPALPGLACLILFNQQPGCKLDWASHVLHEPRLYTHTWPPPAKGVRESRLLWEYTHSHSNSTSAGSRCVRRWCLRLLVCPDCPVCPVCPVYPTQLDRVY
jgi:hypothetical protein